ncbi:type I-F CRISPR-associated protein Csy2 [Thiorhodococcus mannitoliphagus]|uniref:Type I-F CRISPR-associated protein Csy2 n=1 Tax=Thiorhodococcus mannitoliphagus TaxID=329406 RepID=A0A6P1DZY1_9GAMM|nr:type I-F CRISPR-associated protein Csy2 [Thiorhodococcus mannitoliphagus]NEX23060.1 type I-F CRISPR-associated protein Csy2 [Thiorhodococcus mannitoliphagus]
MSSESSIPEHQAVLVLPHIRVQSANAISSPMTWGFPAITAFTGLMTALERRLGRDSGLALYGIGVICHGFEAQITHEGYTRAFRLTRNPLRHDGSTAAIVEEGRAHLDLTLVFDARLTDDFRGDAERVALADRVADELAGMRLAGGSVMPGLPIPARRPTRPVLELVPDDGQSDEQHKAYGDWFRRLARRWLPGFALVSRDDLLQARLAELREDDPAATALDAWLDLSRWNARAVERPTEHGSHQPPRVEWVNDPRAGWIVPIPVGFAALSDLQPPGSVKGARDMSTPFRFVETVWSMGQWVSPHRLKGLDDLIWVTDHDPEHPSEHGLYRCRNAYHPPAAMPEPADLTNNIQP